METKVLTHRRYQPKSYVIGALLTLWSSSIGKKAVMSLTGIVHDDLCPDAHLWHTQDLQG